MAAISCLIARADDPSIHDCANRLERGMVYFPHQVSYLERLCGGSVHLCAVVNCSGEEAKSQYVRISGDLACAVEGHIARAKESVGVEGLLDSCLYADAVIAAYRSRGRHFAQVLEGQFNTILVDAASRVVLAANGRHAQSPLYICEDPKFVAVATSLGPLGACGLFTPRPDLEAIGTFLTYGQLFGRQTLIEGISVLDGACTVEWELDRSECRRRRYWDYGAIGPKLDHVPERGLVKNLCDLFHASADRMVQRSGRIVSGLSGGNDSRMVTGLAAHRRRDLRAWTFGTPDSMDLKVAAEICRILGIGHLRFSVEGGGLEEYADGFVTLVDGSMTAAHSFFLPRAMALGAQADVVLNGYGGDYLLQGGLLDLGPRAALDYARFRAGLASHAPHPHIERNGTRDSIAAYIEARYGKQSALAPMLFPPPPAFSAIVHGELDRVGSAIPHEYQVEHWGFENRGRRWTMLGSVNDRHFYGDDCVYYDDDLFDYCLACPPSLRRGNRLHNVVLEALLPELARIVSSNTGLPANSPAWRVNLLKARRFISGKLAGGGGGYSTGVDIQGWARQAQRPFYLRLLADTRTQQRSFWDGKMIQARYEAFLTGGAAFGREMGLVTAIELFLRRWVDNR